jgi:hypothetical protein
MPRRSQRAGTLPPPNVRVYDWYKIAAAARKNEGRWDLCLRQVTKSLPGAHKRGAMKALWPADGWAYELRVRNTNGTKGDIWIRAVREETADATSESDDGRTTDG